MNTSPDYASSAAGYSAPALEKGLDILELLCRTEEALSQKQIAQELGRSVSEIYRMLMCLVKRNYVGTANDTYFITTRLFELAHSNPPTQRLLVEARPIMEMLAVKLDQSCHLTIWGNGSQVVIAKVDAPSGLGFSVRLGSELDVLVSASGRVLLAFQEDLVKNLRLSEAAIRRPAQVDLDIESKLAAIRKRGFESSRSRQVRGMHTVSYPITDSQGRALAAIAVPYTERIDEEEQKSLHDVEEALGLAVATLCARLGGRSIART